MRKAVVASAHPYASIGLGNVLLSAGLDVVIAAPNSEAICATTTQHHPDVFVLDISLPDFDGIAALEILRRQGLVSPVVLLAPHFHDVQLHSAFRASVDGLVELSAGNQALLEAVAVVLNGGQVIPPHLWARAQHSARQSSIASRLAELSPRARSVANAVLAGLSNHAIAEKLGIGEGGVRVALHRLYNQFGVANRTELALLIREHAAHTSSAP